FSMLKLYVNREDRVALRWLLGVENTSWRAGPYQRVRTYCENVGITPWQALERLSVDEIKLPHTNSLIARFQEIRTEIERLEALPNLEAAVNDLLPDGNDVVRDLRSLALQTLEIVGDDREAFLVELTSSIAKPEVPMEVCDVRIMSLHKSKGRSSPVTIISGCVQGLLPRLPDANLTLVEQRALLEEQRRLFYVGITRVKAVPEEGKRGKLFLT